MYLHLKLSKSDSTSKITPCADLQHAKELIIEHGGYIIKAVDIDLKEAAAPVQNHTANTNTTTNNGAYVPPVTPGVTR